MAGDKTRRCDVTTVAMEIAGNFPEFFCQVFQGNSPTNCGSFSHSPHSPAEVHESLAAPWYEDFMVDSPTQRLDWGG